MRTTSQQDELSEFFRYGGPKRLTRWYDTLLALCIFVDSRTLQLSSEPRLPFICHRHRLVSLRYERELRHNMFRNLQSASQRR